MSEFFIKRPNFAWVVALFISLAGLLVISKLPVAQYPNVAPPQITITATYPGASAKVLVDSVTSVLEESLNGAKGLLYFESTNNSNGTAEIVVTFEPGTDPDLAQVDVQNRLKKAEARMPQAVLTQGLQVEQTSAGFLLIYALSYKEGAQRSDTTALGDYAARNINNELRRLPGVGKLQFFSSEAAMRVWIDPQKLVGFGLSIDDVSNAIRGQNVQVPAGAFGSAPGSSAQELTATLAVKGTLDDPQEFGQVVLRANEDGSLVRLADVARLELGKESYNISSRLNGTPTVGGAIQLSPGANAIQTATLVKQRLAELSAFFPEDMQYSVPYDTSRFVDVAIEKVIHTLIEAMVLVFLVMFLFLQNVRYTLIPSIVVPVCLLGTLMVMYLLGFSVNMMTMFGMVLAIGILVDDAIVVVENVERIMAEEGISPAEATVKAMKQVSGAIVGITLVLSAVFLPLAFMAGSVGVRLLLPAPAGSLRAGGRPRLHGGRRATAAWRFARAHRCHRRGTRALPQVPRGGGFGVPDLGLQLLRPGRQCRAGLPDLQGLVRARRRAVGRRRDRRAERAFRAARRWHGHGRVAATDQRSG